MTTKEEWLKFLSDRKTAYQTTFGSHGGAAVLADLAPFCRANETCLIPGERDKTAALEGRREVYLRILDHLQLTPEQLVEKYTRPAQGAISHDRSDTSGPV